MSKKQPQTPIEPKEGAFYLNYEVRVYGFSFTSSTELKISFPFEIKLDLGLCKKSSDSLIAVWTGSCFKYFLKRIFEYLRGHCL